MSGARRSATALLGLALVLMLGGCATVPGEGQNRNDPWETFNRKVYAFNDVVDQAAIKPAAQLYQKLLPSPVRSGVDNFFANLTDVWTSANLFLQVKPRAGLEMGMRVIVNTTVGVGGLVDVAEDMGLERSAHEDFGQTLGYWGLRSGPYLVLPLLGPATLRDAAGSVLDYPYSGPSLVWQEPRDRNGASILQLLNARVQLLNASRLLDDIALDKYLLLRDAYLARRKSLIYDGDPPDDDTAPAPFKKLVK